MLNKRRPTGKTHSIVNNLRVQTKAMERFKCLLDHI